MPQKGLKKVMGLGEAEKTFLKSFFRFLKHQLLSDKKSYEMDAKPAFFRKATA